MPVAEAVERWPSITQHASASIEEMTGAMVVAFYVCGFYVLSGRRDVQLSRSDRACLPTHTEVVEGFARIDHGRGARTGLPEVKNRTGYAHTSTLLHA